jgi:hypothetical protein
VTSTGFAYPFSAIPPPKTFESEVLRPTVSDRRSFAPAFPPYALR